MEINYFSLAFCFRIIFSISLLFVLPAQALSVEGFASPESVAADAQGKRIFVSNIGTKLDPTAKDGDGFISEISADGSIVRKFFTPKGTLNAPKGLATTQDTIYVTDIDRVVGFDLNSGRQVFSLDFSSTGSSFLNDLVAINDQTLLVTTSDLGTIYRISVTEKKFSPFSGHIPGANGIAYFPQNKQVVVNGLGDKFNGKGSVYIASLQDTTPVFKRLNSPEGYLDGIAFLDGNSVIYSDWVGIQNPIPGVINRLNLRTNKVDTLILPMEVHGPADFYYQPTTRLFFLPLTLDGKVIISKLTFSGNSANMTAAGPISAIATPIYKKTLIALPPGFKYPNGTTRDKNGTLYVGSVTSGQILQIKPDGRIETFFAGNSEIFASTSLRLDEQRGILWGTSPDFLGVLDSKSKVFRRPHRIFAIDARTGKVLRVIPIPDGGFGNDLALDQNGGVYITDSSRPRIYYLSPGTTQLQVWVEDERFRSSQIGLAGIARTSDGVLIVGSFSEGRLFKVTPKSEGPPNVEAIALERSIENPDGMQFAPDGSLLILEGALTGGNGRLLQIKNILTSEPKPKVIETLVENLESPVNLTVAGREIWVTEAHIRHRLFPEKRIAIPNRFFIHHFVLPDSKVLSQKP
jgi:sugar lactone lactonase YvrE